MRGLHGRQLLPNAIDPASAVQCRHVLILGGGVNGSLVRPVSGRHVFSYGFSDFNIYLHLVQGWIVRWLLWQFRLC